MELKNKKTGEILEDVKNIDTSLSTIEIHYLDNGVSRMETCKSFKDFLEEWEDYEEPKEHWFISEFGHVYSLEHIPMDKERTELVKAIGNCFDTKEEAEKAVEKLKAAKRLKDKGFRFISYDMPSDSVFNIQIRACCDKADYIDIMDELDLLFGGEE